MGWNTTVVVMNDSLHAIEKDPEFGKNLASAILRASSRSGRVDVHAGSHANAAHVVESHHADQTAVVAVGGNLGRVVAELYGWDFKDTEELFKKLAETLGYSVRKKK